MGRGNIMNREDFEKATNIAVEIENIKEVISMLESGLTLKLKGEMMFTAYLKEKELSEDIREVIVQNLRDKLKELNEEFENM